MILLWIKKIKVNCKGLNLQIIIKKETIYHRVNIITEMENLQNYLLKINNNNKMANNTN